MQVGIERLIARAKAEGWVEGSPPVVWDKHKRAFVPPDQCTPEPPRKSNPRYHGLPLARPHGSAGVLSCLGQAEVGLGAAR